MLLNIFILIQRVEVGVEVEAELAGGRGGGGVGARGAGEEGEGEAGQEGKGFGRGCHGVGFVDLCVRAGDRQPIPSRTRR